MALSQYGSGVLGSDLKQVLSGDGAAEVPSVAAVNDGLDTKASTSHNHTGVYDPAGSAATAQTTAEAYADSLMGTHEGASDPHPQYLTATEGNLAYDAAGSAASAASGAASALSAHEADTTNIHGIADTSALLDTSDIGTAVQAYDADLAAIAALAPSDDAFIQRKSSAWTSRTPAQVTADLPAVVGDFGSGGTKGLVPAPGAGDATAGKFLKADGTWDVPAGGGSGDVTGPSSAVDNRIARFDGTTGKLIQNSGASIDDSGNISATNLSGTNTGDQTITLTGDVTGSGTGSFAASIGAGVVTNAKLADVSTSTIKGRSTAGTGSPEDLTATQVRTLINVADGANNYTHPNHSGDVTSSGDGATTIAAQAVTYAKIQNVSATDKLLGRSTAGAGSVEEIACTAAGRALLDDADATAQRSTLGLGTLATQNGTFSGTSSGTNTGDQTITLTGDVTGSGTGSFSATIANDAVTYAKIQNVSATDKLLGRSSSGSGDVEEITCTAAGRALIDDASASAQRTTLGLGTAAVLDAPASGNAASGEVVKGSDTRVAQNRGITFGSFGAAADGTLVLTAYAAFAGTINSLKALKTASGTITATVKINGTNVTGLASLSVTSTAQNPNASGANTFAIGDAITVVLASNSSATDLQGTLNITPS